MQNVYLCHKCYGELSYRKDGPKLLFGCGCISGWVRDWQEPITYDAALAIQTRTKRIELIWQRENNQPFYSFNY